VSLSIPLVAAKADVSGPVYFFDVDVEGNDSV
jgi:hypothetical protein